MTKNDIITGTVTGILGNFAYAFITGLKDESATIMESVLNILKAPIPLWYFLTVLLVVGLLMYACVCVRTYRLSKKALPFLEVTERDYGGFLFNGFGRRMKKQASTKCQICGLFVPFVISNFELNYMIQSKGIIVLMVMCIICIRPWTKSATFFMSFNGNSKAMPIL